jgi:tetratricopeptide (TPR) repeat protein
MNREAHVPDVYQVLRERYEALQGHFNSADHIRLQAPKQFSHPINTALEDAEAGRIAQARRIEDQMFQGDLERDERLGLALSFARTGRTEEAERVADKVSQERPLDLLVHKYLVPIVRAAVKLEERDPKAAVDLLRDSTPYELAQTPSIEFLYPAYLRGQAYLELGDGRSAAHEFQKLIDNPGSCGEFIIGSLAWLQLGRSQSLMGDNESASKSYEEFLKIWKDADRDVPVFRQAKAE